MIQALLLFATTLCATQASNNIVDLALATPTLSTLVTALKAGNLIKPLRDPGSFTVFAPTNAAFDALPKGVLANLLKPVNKASLDDLLTYHVLGDEVHSNKFLDGEMLRTLEQKYVTVRLAGKDILINSAKVTTADIQASNGVIHIIDAVLLPSSAPPSPGPSPAPSPGTKNIVQLAEATPSLSTLVTALGAASLVKTLEGTGPFTVFAPTNDAFKSLPEGVLANLLLPKNKAKLADLLTFHVVSGDIHAADILDGERLKTVEGMYITAAVNSSGVFLNNAKVTTADVNASNGVVHIINEVLQEWNPSPSPGPSPSKNHLWFNLINRYSHYPVGRCGEVDAAPRIPPKLFEPQYKAVLQKYIKATLKFYGGSLGRCADRQFPSSGGSSAVNYTQYDGTVVAEWLPDAFVPVCRSLCGCDPHSTWNPSFPTGRKICKETPLNCACADVDDEPGKGHFCSLCGPKYNGNINITLYLTPGSKSELESTNTTISKMLRGYEE